MTKGNNTALKRKDRFGFLIIFNICNTILYESLWKEKKIKVFSIYILNNYMIQHDQRGVINVCRNKLSLKAYSTLLSSEWLNFICVG